MAFFPFDPRALRLQLYLAAACGAGLVAWAGWGLFEGTERFAAPRAVVGATLVVAISRRAWRLRRRPGYGVRVEATTLVVALPLSGEVALASSELTEVARLGVGRSKVIELTLRGGRTILLPRSFFASDEAFARLGVALEEAAPAPAHQA